MKIVIDIPEEYLDSEVIHITAVTGVDNKITDVNVESAYAEFQVLPKGHGRLIDAEKFANYVNDLKEGWNRCGNEYESGRYESYDYVADTIENAPTIIEADKEAENES